MIDPIPSLRSNGLVRRFGPGRISAVKWMSDKAIWLIASGGASTFGIDAGGSIAHGWDLDCPAWYGTTSPDGSVVALGTGENIYLWRNAQLIQIPDPSRLFALSPGGNLLATFTKPVLKLWDVVKREVVYSENEKNSTSEWSEVSTLSFSPDGQYLALGLYASHWLASIRRVEENRLSTASHMLVREDKKADDRQMIAAIAFSPQMDLLALADNSQFLWVWRFRWDVYPHPLVGQLPYSSWGSIDWSTKRRSLAFRPDGKLLALGTPVGAFTCDPHSARSLDRAADLPGHDYVSVDFNSTGGWLACAKSRTLEVRNVGAGAEATRMVTNGGKADRMALCPSVPWLALGDSDGVSVLDINSGREIWRSEEVEYIESLAFSCDGRWLAAGGRIWDAAKGESDQVIQIYDGVTGTRIHRIRFFHCVCLAFTPDSSYLACCGVDAAWVHLLDTKSWQEVKNWEPRKSFASYDSTVGIAFSVDGKFLATANHSGLGVWNLPGGRLAQRLSSGKYMSVMFSPNGRYLAAGSDSGWQIWGRTEAGFLKPPTWSLARERAAGPVKSVAVGAVGQYLATGGATLNLWEANTGGVKRFQDITDVSQVAFTADGQYLISNSDVVRMWKL